MAAHLHSIFCAIFCSILAAIACGDESTAKTSPPTVRVAVYQDAGVSDKVADLIELLRTHSELTVSKVRGADIRGGTLDHFDVVLFPGGSGSKEAASLEESG